MDHATEILEERECLLKSLIRQCKENSDKIMQEIPTKKYEQQLADIEHALTVLDQVDFPDIS